MIVIPIPRKLIPNRDESLVVLIVGAGNNELEFARPYLFARAKVILVNIYAENLVQSKQVPVLLTETK
jgi:hypothetical protein